ncbi:hypothetical protein [Streptomyces venezuelae]|uniref:Type II toxin-antitoxin system RelE/ParE family toxin n=1 Tax=Streptomyces venezuelae TaxID=54571 RepID=A0A5P2B5U9_STRVZ|nr:hypothetical protein [Streptomyces venezuelae]QES25863.1 hypothetical protein DEJ47_04800 [Streptomyces venezuelae]
MTGWEFEYDGHALASWSALPAEQRLHLDGIAARLVAAAEVKYPDDPEYGDPGVSALLQVAETPWVVSYQLHRPRRRVYIVQILGPSA